MGVRKNTTDKMGVDYYSILNLTRSASDADIKRNYRKLSLKHHPEKNSDDQAAADKFMQVAEAYDVLSDPRKRAVYDQFGEEGLKNGVPAGSGESGAWTRSSGISLAVTTHSKSSTTGLMGILVWALGACMGGGQRNRTLPSSGTSSS